MNIEIMIISFIVIHQYVCQINCRLPLMIAYCIHSYAHVINNCQTISCPLFISHFFLPSIFSLSRQFITHHKITCISHFYMSSQSLQLIPCQSNSSMCGKLNERDLKKMFKLKLREIIGKGMFMFLY